MQTFPPVRLRKILPNLSISFNQHFHYILGSGPRSCVLRRHPNTLLGWKCCSPTQTDFLYQLPRLSHARHPQLVHQNQTTQIFPACPSLHIQHKDRRISCGNPRILQELQDKAFSALLQPTKRTKQLRHILLPILTLTSRSQRQAYQLQEPQDPTGSYRIRRFQSYLSPLEESDHTNISCQSFPSHPDHRRRILDTGSTDLRRFESYLSNPTMQTTQT